MTTVRKRKRRNSEGTVSLKKSGGFPRDLLESMKRGTISYGVCLVLRFISIPGRKQVISLFRQLGTGVNRMKEISENILDITKRDSISVKTLLGSEKITGILNEPISKKQKTEKLRRVLRELRFPLLSARENNVKKIIRSMNLPGTIKIDIPVNFDDKYISLSLRVSSSREIEHAIERLKDNDKQIRRLLELL